MVSEETVDKPNTNVIVIESDTDEESNGDSTSFFRDMSLTFWVSEPLKLDMEHYELKELCLKNDNHEAHYIEGILKYFVHEQERKGLFHLRKSGTLHNPNGMYLYGLLMLARGHYRKGEKWLDKLNWFESLSTSDRCWERIKKSLRRIVVVMQMKYYVNMVNLKPRTKCDPPHNIGHCKHCYYFKRLNIYGVLVGVGFLEEYITEASNGNVGFLDHRIRFYVVNMEYDVVKCVAYGAMAQTFNDLWNSTDADIVLCVLQFWKIDWENGRFKKITNIDGFSKIVFEPRDVPEIDAFRKKIADNGF